MECKVPGCRLDVNTTLPIQICKKHWRILPFGIKVDAWNAHSIGKPVSDAQAESDISKLAINSILLFESKPTDRPMAREAYSRESETVAHLFYEPSAGRLSLCGKVKWDRSFQLRNAEDACFACRNTATADDRAASFDGRSTGR